MAGWTWRFSFVVDGVGGRRHARAQAAAHSVAEPGEGIDRGVVQGLAKRVTVQQRGLEAGDRVVDGCEPQGWALAPHAHVFGDTGGQAPGHGGEVGFAMQVGVEHAEHRPGAAHNRRAGCQPQEQAFGGLALEPGEARGVGCGVSGA